MEKVILVPNMVGGWYGSDTTPTRETNNK
jgi:hypothetical protein